MNQLKVRDPEIHCAICGHELDGDPDDQPWPPLGPICGECYRAQQMDDDIDAARLLSDAEQEFEF
jgi:hypothetical protein